MSYLALDLGSSFVKAAMLDTKNGIIYGTASQNHLLMRRIAVEIDRPWECSPVQDEVMLGLYRVALLCSSEIQEIQDTKEYIR